MFKSQLKASEYKKLPQLPWLAGSLGIWGFVVQGLAVEGSNLGFRVQGFRVQTLGVGFRFLFISFLSVCEGSRASLAQAFYYSWVVIYTWGSKSPKLGCDCCYPT